MIAVFLTTGIGAMTGCARRVPPPAEDSPGLAGADSLLAAHAPILEEWVQLWRRAIPSFGLDSMRAGPLHPFDLSAIGVVPLDSSGFHRPAREGLYVWSPDSTWAVDPNYYMDVGPDGEPGFEPDAGVALIHRRDRVWRSLAFSGTPARWDDVFWLDSSRFLVAGWKESPQRPWRWRPTLDLWDLGARRIRGYWGPWVNERARGAYEAAFDSAFVAKRSPARAV